MIACSLQCLVYLIVEILPYRAFPKRRKPLTFLQPTCKSLCFGHNNSIDSLLMESANFLRRLLIVDGEDTLELNKEASDAEDLFDGSEDFIAASIIPPVPFFFCFNWKGGLKHPPSQKMAYVFSLGHHVLATLSGDKKPAYLAEVNDHFNKRHQAHAEKEPHIATKRTWNRGI